MKKVALLAVTAILSMGSAAYASNPQSAEAPSFTNESPQVCQFSLSRYTGTIVIGGYTQEFTVGLSCPQKEAIHATVVVYIDDEPVASKVVTVPANKTQSGSTCIKVGSSYNGKTYRMIVQ